MLCNTCKNVVEYLKNGFRVPGTCFEIMIWSGWKIIDNSGIDQLVKTFNFDSYQDASVFTQKVADLADHEDHHPKIILEYGKVEVFWWSHKIKGLHKNDFICAAKTDLL